MATVQAVNWDYLTDNAAWYLTGTAAQNVTWTNTPEPTSLTVENIQRLYGLIADSPLNLYPMQEEVLKKIGVPNEYLKKTPKSFNDLLLERNK